MSTSATDNYPVAYLPLEVQEDTFYSNTFTGVTLNAHMAFSNPSTTLAVVDQIDCTVTGTGAASFVCYAMNLDTNCIFWYDSQSVGQGGGIRFAWRGRLPRYSGQGLQVTLTCPTGTATNALAIEVRGYYKPSPSVGLAGP